MCAFSSSPLPSPRPHTPPSLAPTQSFTLSPWLLSVPPLPPDPLAVPVARLFGKHADHALPQRLGVTLVHVRDNHRARQNLDRQQTLHFLPLKCAITPPGKRGNRERWRQGPHTRNRRPQALHILPHSCATTLGGRERRRASGWQGTNSARHETEQIFRVDPLNKVASRNPPTKS